MTTKEVHFDNRTVTVRQLRVRDSAKIERMRQEAQAVPDEDPDVQVMREYFYPILAICSEGDVPTEEEFLNMPVLEANIWYEALDELNPGILSGVGEEPDDEKKVSSQPTSTES
jgi:hypothetical protein